MATAAPSAPHTRRRHPRRSRSSRTSSSTRRGALEDRDELKRRIEQASKFVDIEQLCLSPQCGFSSTVEGNVLSYEDEVAKLELIVETARDVWG